MAASDKEKLGRIAKLHAQHGDAWPFKWLEENGVSYEYLHASLNGQGRGCGELAEGTPR